MTIASILFLALGPNSSEKISFSSSSNNKLLFKFGMVSRGGGADKVFMLLQNVSGEELKVTRVDASGSLSSGSTPIRLNSATEFPITVAVGQELRLDRIDIPAKGFVQGGIRITFLDAHNAKDTADLNISGVIGS